MIRINSAAKISRYVQLVARYISVDYVLRDVDEDYRIVGPTGDSIWQLEVMVRLRP